MPSKRKEVLSSPQRQVKKTKRDPQTEKLNQQLQEVLVALSTAPITSEVANMLESVAQLSLGEFSDQRHHFQDQVVEALAGILGEAETVLRKEVADVRSQRDVAASEKARHEKDFEEASGKLKAKADEVHGFKVTLAGKAVAFREATRSLADAAEAKKIDGKKAQEAEKKKSDFEAGIEDLMALKTVLPEDEEASQRADKLMKLLKRYKFEESMMIALPAALAKAPDARGQFDLMALTELEGEVSKLITEQQDVISAAAPSQEKCDAVVREAQERLTASRAEQRAAARKFDIASEEQAALEATANEAQKTLRSLIQLAKRLQVSLNNAEVEVELFEQGPCETFKELRERTTPAPVVEDEPSAPNAEEQQTDVAEMEVAVAAC